MGTVIIQKGAEDKISDGKYSMFRKTIYVVTVSIAIVSKEEGSPRRCGGQGDVLSGMLATFLAWGRFLHSQQQSKQQQQQPDEGEEEWEGSTTALHLLAGYGACMLLKKCAVRAFMKHKRSTTTPNIIEEIGPVFEEHFPALSSPDSKL